MALALAGVGVGLWVLGMAFVAWGLGRDQRRALPTPHIERVAESGCFRRAS